MPNISQKVLYPELSYEIIGILFAVQNELDTRYQEKYYQRAVEVKLKYKKIGYKRELMVDLKFEEEKIGKYYLDFLIQIK